MKYKRTAVVLCLVIFALTLHNLAYVPEPWFDEGWVLSVARNWVVSGHYGLFLQGRPVPATILNAGLPATGPVAASFYFFGIGIWQGRWPNVLFLMGTCLLVYHLAQRLYGRKVAVWTLVLLLLLPMYPHLHPIFMGRQALGEIPAMFFLLAGYALLFATWQRRDWYILVAPIFFGLALQTKPQILPFFVVSLFVPMLGLAVWPRLGEAGQLLLSLGLTIIFSGILSWISRLFLSSSLFSTSSGGDLYAMTGQLDVLLTYVAVFDLSFRGQLLLKFLILLVGLPVIVGVVYVGGQQWRHLPYTAVSDFRPIWILILWTFVFSWLGWFFLLSIGFLRYLFPAILIGTIFVTKFFNDITSEFSFATVVKTLTSNLRYHPFRATRVRLFLSGLFFVSSTTVTLLFLLPIIAPIEDTYTQVLRFLNNETPPTALIETYDSELFLLLQRDYHYPPDAVQHSLNQKVNFGREMSVHYDPMPLGIDYVVIGWSRIWPLYDSVLNAENAELVYENAQYRVFKIK